MADHYADLAHFSLAAHGDAREREFWPGVAIDLCNYEIFWRELIVLLTTRVMPVAVAGPEWVRLRPSIPFEYETMAMHNYSAFYFAATAWRAIEDDRERLGSGAYPHPERVFAAMEACVEQAKPLQNSGRKILRSVGIDRPKLPKHPDGLYKTIGAYRNTFAHTPVLGRAVAQGRELLPPEHRLPKNGFLLWREAGGIPTDEMVDGLKLEHDLWGRLAGFLQVQWKELAEAFIKARKQEQFIMDLGLRALLPIRCAS